MAAISNHVSLAAPFRVSAAGLESCLILWILNEDSKHLESQVAVRVKYTLQKKVSCLQQASLIQPGQIQVFPGQWVIRVSGTDPVSTLSQSTIGAIQNGLKSGIKWRVFMVAIFEAASTAAAAKVKVCHHPWHVSHIPRSSVFCSPINASKNFANKISKMKISRITTYVTTVLTLFFTGLIFHEWRFFWRFAILFSQTR